MPEPEFGISGTSIFVRIRKDILTEDYLEKLGLNERQIKAVMFVKKEGKITNKEYRTLFGGSDRTALRDLTGLCKKGILQKIGTTGRKIEYILTRHKPEKPDINPTKIRHKNKKNNHT